MRPLRGPCVWKVPGSDGLVLAVSPGAGSVSRSALLPFRFPRSAIVDGVIVVPSPHLVLTMAQQAATVGLCVTDEEAQAIVTDTRATIRGTTNAPAAVNLMALSGRAEWQPFPLQRHVRAGLSWFFELQNDDLANTITIAGIFLLMKGGPR